MSESNDDENNELPPEAKGVSANSLGTKVSAQMKPIRTEVYWRCLCGGGALLGVEKCEVCGQPPTYKAK